MPPYAIMISSQKGGVGKTTVAINLAMALTVLGRKTMLMDGNSANPSLAIELGMDTRINGLARMLNGGKLKDCVSVHKQSGLHVMLLSESGTAPKAGLKQAAHMTKEFALSDYEFIIVDTAPGYISLETLRHMNEAIIVATPDMPSVSNLIELSKIYDKKRLRHSLIVNSMDPKNYSVSMSAIRQSYDGEILGQLPRDDAVFKSAMKNVPVVFADRNCRFSKEMLRIADVLQSRRGAKGRGKTSKGVLGGIFGK